MAKNKALPLLLIFGGAGALLLSSKKASAKSSSGSTTGTGEMPPINVPTDVPSGGGDTPKPNKPKPADPAPKPQSVGPVTAMEVKNIEWAVNGFGDTVNSDIVPAPWNVRKPETPALDWKTNLAFWLTYSRKDSDWIKSGHQQVPFGPLKTDMAPVDGQGFAYWSQVWKRIRDYIKKNYKNP